MKWRCDFDNNKKNAAPVMKCGLGLKQPKCGKWYNLLYKFKHPENVSQYIRWFVGSDWAIIELPKCN